MRDIFIKRLENLPSKIWQQIAKIDELKGKWIGGAELSPQVLGRLKKSVLVTSTGASTRIEGARLSDQDIEKLIKGISIQRFSNRDKQEVKGYYELLTKIFDSWKHIRFTENTLKHFHQEMLKHVEKDKNHRGIYKKRENKVAMINEAGESVGVLFDTTPAYLTPKVMQELIEATGEALQDKNFHPLLVIGNFLVEFLYIHPFQDGNGRLSRIATNLLMLQAGYQYIPYVSHEKLIEDNKPNYYLALRKSQKTLKTKKPSIVSWLDFFLAIVLKQSEMAVGLLSGEQIDKLLSEKQLSVWRYLQSVKEASPRQMAEKTKIPRPTINQVVNKLLFLKKVERIGLGRSTRYRKLN
jgi:Fic family protein